MAVNNNWVHSETSTWGEGERLLLILIRTHLKAIKLLASPSNDYEIYVLSADGTLFYQISWNNPRLIFGATVLQVLWCWASKVMAPVEPSSDEISYATLGTQVSDLKKLLQAAMWIAIMTMVHDSELSCVHYTLVLILVIGALFSELLVSTTMFSNCSAFEFLMSIFSNWKASF